MVKKYICKILLLNIFIFIIYLKKKKNYQSMFSSCKTKKKIFIFSSWNCPGNLSVKTLAGGGHNLYLVAQNCWLSYNQAQVDSQWPLFSPHPLSSSPPNYPPTLHRLSPQPSLSLLSPNPILSLLLSQFLLLSSPPPQVPSAYLSLPWMSRHRRRKSLLSTPTVVVMQWLASTLRNSFWVLAMRSQSWLLVRRIQTRWRSLHSADFQLRFYFFIFWLFGFVSIWVLWVFVFVVCLICSCLGFFWESQNFPGNHKCWGQDCVGRPCRSWEGCGGGGIWCCSG